MLLTVPPTVPLPFLSLHFPTRTVLVSFLALCYLTLVVSSLFQFQKHLVVSVLIILSACFWSWYLFPELLAHLSFHLDITASQLLSYYTQHFKNEASECFLKIFLCIWKKLDTFKKSKTEELGMKSNSPLTHFCLPSISFSKRGSSPELQTRKWPEQLISHISQGWYVTSTIPDTQERSSFMIYSGCLRALELISLWKSSWDKVLGETTFQGDHFPILLICLYHALFNWSILDVTSRLFSMIDDDLPSLYHHPSIFPFLM